MAFATYTEARAALAELNARCYALKAPKLTADVADHVAYNAARRALRDEANAKGFVSIFDGSYKLNAAQVKLTD